MMFRRQSDKTQEELMIELSRDLSTLSQLVFQGHGGTTMHKRIKRAIKQYREANYSEQELLKLLTRMEVRIKMYGGKVPWKSVL